MAFDYVSSVMRKVTRGSEREGTMSLMVVTDFVFTVLVVCEARAGFA